jgi:hypothetical protein
MISVIEKYAGNDIPDKKEVTSLFCIKNALEFVKKNFM